MKIDNVGQTDVISAAAAEVERQKRRWIAPMLTHEDTKHGTRTKISNTGDFVVGASHEGVAS